MNKMAPTYISELGRQRTRLKADMTEEAFANWHATTLVKLYYIPEIEPLRQRFVEIGRNNESVNDRVRMVRGIPPSMGTATTCLHSSTGH